MNGYISIGQADRQLAINHHTTGGEVGHGFSCSVCYVELKIWLFSIVIDLHAILWPPPTSTVCGIGYTGVKLSKMASNSASYPFDNWCINRL